jgi:hypothetical protein
LTEAISEPITSTHVPSMLSLELNSISLLGYKLVLLTIFVRLESYAIEIRF